MIELAGENDATGAGFAHWMCYYHIIMQQPASLTGCHQLICLETPTGGFYCMLQPLGVIVIVYFALCLLNVYFTVIALT